MDKLERCPVIVQPYPVEGDDPDEFQPNERCSQEVVIRFHQARDEDGYLGTVRVFAECMDGHTLTEMEHDINLDLDGVPLGA